MAFKDCLDAVSEGHRYLGGENPMNRGHQQERLPKKEKYLKYYLAGFIDGEGCFSVSVKPLPSARFGWVVNPMFQVYQHRKNRRILELCRRVFHCGYITQKSGRPNNLVYIVDNLRSLKEKVLPFFWKHPLLSEKQGEFERFARIIEKLWAKEHLTREGLAKIIRLAFTMNRGEQQRKYKLKEIMTSLAESSETTRQT